MQNSRFDYSSLHIEPPSDLSCEITKWACEHVDDDDIYVSYQDFTYGREDEIHVTALFGIHSDNSSQIRTIIGRKPINVQLGEVRVFSNPFKFDVVNIQVFSQDLVDLNKLLVAQVPFTNKYKTYNPHLTIAYVKKGKGWKHNGLDLWKGRKFTSDYLIFSSKNGTKERIVL